MRMVARGSGGTTAAGIMRRSAACGEGGCGHRQVHDILPHWVRQWQVLGVALGVALGVVLGVAVALGMAVA